MQNIQIGIGFLNGLVSKWSGYSYGPDHLKSRPFCVQFFNGKNKMAAKHLKTRQVQYLDSHCSMVL